MKEDRKQRVAILFGGRSPEHWISFKSALFAMLYIDRTRYEVSAVYLDEGGRFVSGEGYLVALERFFERNRMRLFGEDEELGDWMELLRSAASGHSGDFMQAAIDGNWDLFFPLFHGRPGEDGSVQALARRLGLPYAGCNMAGSSAGIDKIITKQIVSAAGLAVAPWRIIERPEWEARGVKACDALVKALGLPLFVKPARLGSSIGVSRATSIESLGTAIEEALVFDTRVIVESEIRGPECAVGLIGEPGRLRSSVVAEFTSSPEDFGYDSKYGPAALPDHIPARFDPAASRALIEFSEKVFTTLKMKGICRVDSFLGPEGPLLNEVNTMPGLGPGSPFVRVFEEAGLSRRGLFSAILESAVTAG
ncbi:MAG: D-alanine--D-alanine ligase [Rectinemataceae bacterium]